MVVVIIKLLQSMDKLKICVKCKKQMLLDCFHKQSNTKDGHTNDCKECRNRSGKYWYEKNKKRHAESGKIWRKNNPEKSKEYS